MNIREVSSDENKNREVSAWSYNSSMVSNRAHAAHAIFNNSELAVWFVHVESRDQFRHMHSARFYRMADLGEKGGEHAGKNGFLLEMLQPNLVSV